MTLDLNAMDHSQLLSLRNDVEKALKTVDARRKAEARKAAIAAAKEHGFSLDELIGEGGKGGKTTKGEPRYKNPENEDQTWTGRGRKPNWVIAWVDAGNDLEALAI